MSDDTVTITLSDGRKMKMPYAQALMLAETVHEFEHPVWHVNECGCCVSVHESGESDCGYVIGSDGERDWIVDVESSS